MPFFNVFNVLKKNFSWNVFTFMVHVVFGCIRMTGVLQMRRTRCYWRLRIVGWKIFTRVAFAWMSISTRFSCRVDTSSVVPLVPARYVTAPSVAHSFAALSRRSSRNRHTFNTMKPKFHYANFHRNFPAVMEFSPRQDTRKVHDKVRRLVGQFNVKSSYWSKLTAGLMCISGVVLSRKI